MPPKHFFFISPINMIEADENSINTLSNKEESIIFKAAMSGGKKRSQRHSSGNKEVTTPSKSVSMPENSSVDVMKSPAIASHTPTKPRNALSLIEDLQSSGRLLRSATKSPKKGLVPADSPLLHLPVSAKSPSRSVRSNKKSSRRETFAGGAEALDMILRDITNDSSSATKQVRRTTMDPDEMAHILNTLNESVASETSMTSVSLPSVAPSPMTRSATKNRRTTIDPADFGDLLDMDDTSEAAQPLRNKRRETVDPADMGSLFDALDDSDYNNASAVVDASMTITPSSAKSARMKASSGKRGRRTTMDPDDIENIMSTLDDSNATEVSMTSASLSSQPRITRSAAQIRKRRETVDPSDLNSLLDTLNDTADHTDDIAAPPLISNPDENVTLSTSAKGRRTTMDPDELADIMNNLDDTNNTSDANITSDIEQGHKSHQNRRETIDPNEMESLMRGLENDTSDSCMEVEQPRSKNRRETIDPADMEDLMNGLNDSTHDDTQSIDMSLPPAIPASSKETGANAGSFPPRRHTIDPAEMSVVRHGETNVLQKEVPSNRRHTLNPSEMLSTMDEDPADDKPVSCLQNATTGDSIVESMSMRQMMQFDESINSPLDTGSQRRQTADPADMMSLLRDLEQEHGDSIATPDATSPKRRETADPAAIAAMIRELQASGDKRLSVSGEIVSLIDQLENSTYSDRSDVSTNTVALMSSVKRLLMEHESPNVSTSDGDTINTQDLLASVGNIVRDIDVDEEDDKFEDTMESVGSLGGLLNLSLDDRPCPLRSCMSTHKSAQKKSVVFGSPNAAEFNSASPITSFTPLHPSTAKSLFPMTAPEPTEADIETLENSQMLAPFQAELSHMSTPPSSKKRRGRANTRTSSSKKRRQSIVHTLEAEFAAQSDDYVSDISHTEVLPDTLAELMTQNGLYSPVQSPISDVALSRIIHPSGVDLDQSSVSHTEVLETDLNALMRHLHNVPTESSGEHEEYTLDGLLPRDQNVEEEEEEPSATRSDESEVSFHHNNSYVSHRDESFTQELEFDIYAMMENCGNKEDDEQAPEEDAMDISRQSEEADDSALYLESRLSECQPANVSDSSDSSMDTSSQHVSSQHNIESSVHQSPLKSVHESGMDGMSSHASSFSDNTSTMMTDESESTMELDESADIIVTENVEMSTIAAKTTPAMLRKIRRLNNDARRTTLEHCQAPLATNVSMSMRNFNFTEAYNQSIEEALAQERAEAQRKAAEKEKIIEQQHRLKLLKDKIAAANDICAFRQQELDELRAKTNMLKVQAAASDVTEQIDELRTSIDIVNTLSYCTVNTFKSTLIVVDCHMSTSIVLTTSYHLTPHHRKPSVNRIAYTLSGNSHIAELYLKEYMVSPERGGPLSPSTLNMITHPSQISTHMNHIMGFIVPFRSVYDSLCGLPSLWTSTLQDKNIIFDNKAVTVSIPLSVLIAGDVCLLPCNFFASKKGASMPLSCSALIQSYQNGSKTFPLVELLETLV